MKEWVIIFTLSLLFCSFADSQVWVRKIVGTGLGNPLAYNPLNTDIVYGAAGSNLIQMSRNRGYTWQNYSFVTGGGVIKSIALSPLDTLQMLVGVEVNGSPDRVVKTTDGGSTWNTTWSGTFNYFGKPVECKPQHPDTVYTMSNDTLWRSIDFGTTWTIVTRVNGLFNNWCDAEIRPDSANIIYVGDNSSGIWKSTDHGLNWRKVYSTVGEIPSIAIDPFNPQVAYASKFGGGGGMVKTTDGGETWLPLTTPIGSGNSWWVTTSIVSPGYVYFGTYGASPTGPFFSRDSGAHWQQIATVDSGQVSMNSLNYGMLVTDTLTVLALQANGAWKLKFPEGIQLQSLTGGEYVQGGAERLIEWRDSNIAQIKLEFTSDNGTSWNILDTVPGGTGAYNWTAPLIVSSICKIRLSNAYNNSVYDISDSPFTIYDTLLALASPNGGEEWDVGSTHDITWVVGAPLDVTISFSPDSGTSWQEIATVNSPALSFVWKIPVMPTTTSCLFRVVKADDSTIADISETTFSIYARKQFTARLEVESASGEYDTLFFGALAGATNGIDTGYGETELAPKPGTEVFDARWKIDGSNGTLTDYRDTLTEFQQENIFTPELQPGAAGFPMTLRWESDSLRAGTYILRDTLTNGSLLFLDMQHVDSLLIMDSTLMGIEILYSVTQSLSMTGAGEWKLISVPFLTGDLKASSIFPNASSPAFSFADGYRAEDSLAYGKGYWVILNQVTFTGGERNIDTVEVQERWNIIGSVSVPLPVSAIQTSSESLVVSNFYGYDDGYFIADMLEPGMGYWVKTSGVGSLILDGANPLLNRAFAIVENGINVNTLTVTDAMGRSQTLLFGANESDGDEMRYEMPPPPPEPLLDVRFASNKIAEFAPKNIKNEIRFPILLKTKSFKNIFSWNVEFDKYFYYILERNVGNHLAGETRLTGTGSISVDDFEGVHYALRLLPIHQSDGPLSFSLSPNYPNPFNPITRVRYTLAHDSYMTLRVFNTLGQEMALLVHSVQEAGVHEIEWNGTTTDGVPVSSGVYFIKMDVKNGAESPQLIFSAHRAVILIK